MVKPSRVNGNHGDERGTEQDERWAASPRLIPKSRGDSSAHLAQVSPGQSTAGTARGNFPAEPCEVSTAECTWLHLTKGKTPAERRDLPQAAQLLAVGPGSAAWLLQQTSSPAPPGRPPPRREQEHPAPIRGASSPKHHSHQRRGPALVSHPWLFTAGVEPVTLHGKKKPLEPHSNSAFHLYYTGAAPEMTGSAPRLCSSKMPLSELFTAYILLITCCSQAVREPAL